LSPLSSSWRAHQLLDAQAFGAITKRVARQAQPGRGPCELPRGRLQDIEQRPALALDIVLGAAPAARLGGGRAGGQSQVGRRQLRLVREQGGALQHVGQLADVAGPGVGQQGGLRVLGEHARGQAVVLAHAPEELLGEHDDVPPARTQRRQRQRDNGQPVIEVGAEAPILHRGRQILAGGRHDGDVQRLAPRAAEAAHLAFLDDLQQLGLQRRRQQADLVEEDRAAPGRLEQTGLALPRVGERAAVEAEQLRLQQGLGDRRAVDVDERAARAAAALVDDVGEQALAGAGLAEDEDRGRRRPGPEADRSNRATCSRTAAIGALSPMT